MSEWKIFHLPHTHPKVVAKRTKHTASLLTIGGTISEFGHLSSYGVWVLGCGAIIAIYADDIAELFSETDG